MVSELLNGFAFPSSKYVETGIRVIRISNVQDGYITDEAPKYYPEDIVVELKKYQLKDGDLLMSLTGNVGRVGFLPQTMLPAVLNQRVCCVRVKDGVLSKDFLFLIFQSEKFRNECEASAKGVAQLNISTEWLKDYLIPLPPKQEQERIVHKIKELFGILDTIEASL